jgi:opacity protein-like surface antigen
MKKLILSLLGVAAISSIGFAGTETYSGKEMKQVAGPPPCPEWYADREFNVGLWGTYVFTGNEWRNDRYIEADHAWGGGIDLKYFFWRYIGVGIEGWAVDARRSFEEVTGTEVFQFSGIGHESRAVGSVLGTLTLRYPIPCTRFSPYIFGGGGGIFGGGETTRFVTTGPLPTIRTEETGSESRAIGQVGAGLEFRFTPHIGWINDFSWNFVDGPDNNFGMVRSGINFAF